MKTTTMFRHMVAVAAVGALALGGCVMDTVDQVPGPDVAAAVVEVGDRFGPAGDAAEPTLPTEVTIWTVDENTFAAEALFDGLPHETLVACTDAFCPPAWDGQRMPLNELPPDVAETILDGLMAEQVLPCTDTYCPVDGFDAHAPVPDAAATHLEGIEAPKVPPCTDTYCPTGPYDAHAPVADAAVGLLDLANPEMEFCVDDQCPNDIPDLKPTPEP